MNKNKDATIGFCLPIAAVVFLAVTKLTGAAELSWWWVFSPLWIIAAMTLVAAIGYYIVCAMLAVMKWLLD